MICLIYIYINLFYSILGRVWNFWDVYILVCPEMDTTTETKHYIFAITPTARQHHHNS